MPLKLLDRYVIEQYFWTIVSSGMIVLAIVFCTGELNAVLQQVVGAGTPATIAILVSLMYVPSALIPCVPAALLVATIMFFHKQSIDGEVLGLAVSGVSFGRMLRAPVLIALLATLFCCLMQEFIIPQSKQIARNLFIVGLHKTTLPVSRENCTKEVYGASGKLERLFIVPDYEGNLLKKVIVLDFSQSSKVQLITADSGQWQKSSWVLKGGHSYDIIGSRSAVTQTAFAQLTIPQLSFLSKKVEESTEKVPEMSTSQLIQHINSLGDPSRVPPKLVLALHERFSRPLACLFLVLAGVPLAIVDRRTRISKGFIYAGLLLFSYYALQSASIGLVENGRLLPLIAAWLPDFVCCVIAMVLIWRKTKQI